MTSGIARRYGWHQPRIPSRRFPIYALTKYPLLSPSRDLTTTGFEAPIWDQGQTGSCTGHGTGAGVSYARAKQGEPFIDISRLFIYWNARALEGTTGSDAGASVADAIQASQVNGDCPYTDLPTDPALVTVPPTATAVADAVFHKALTATRILGSTAASFDYHFKHCLDQLLLPVVFGFTVYESFESDAVAASGIVPMPAASEQVMGGHCVEAVGYDDASAMVTCRNSWGIGWGLKGYFKIPYDYIFDPNMASDFHAIQLES